MQIAGTTNAATGWRTLWIHLPRFEKGPNAVGTYLFHEVLRIKSSDHPGLPTADLALLLAAASPMYAGAKARKLVVQVDNATGENKNKYVFGILALFLLLGWFDEVEMHMLLKGHTHDIQDAVFGVVHREFRAQSTFFAVSHLLHSVMFRDQSGCLPLVTLLQCWSAVSKRIRARHSLLSTMPWISNRFLSRFSTKIFSITPECWTMQRQAHQEPSASARCATATLECFTRTLLAKRTNHAMMAGC